MVVIKIEHTYKKEVTTLERCKHLSKVYIMELIMILRILIGNLYIERHPKFLLYLDILHYNGFEYFLGLFIIIEHLTYYICCKCVGNPIVRGGAMKVMLK